MKACKVCGNTDDLAYRWKNGEKRYQNLCREHEREYYREWQTRTPERRTYKTAWQYNQRQKEREERIRQKFEQIQSAVKKAKEKQAA